MYRFSALTGEKCIACYISSVIADTVIVVGLSVTVIKIIRHLNVLYIARGGGVGMIIGNDLKH